MLDALKEPSCRWKHAEPLPTGEVPERAIVLHVEAWDVNCPQHITRRYTEEQIAPAVAKLQARIADLEAEVARLRSGE